MNKTFVITLIILLVLIAGGVWYFVSVSSSVSYNNAASTPLVAQNNTNTTTTPPQATVPTAITNSTFFPSDNTVLVNGDVNPEGSFTNYWYEYGLTTNLGSKTGNETVGSGFMAIEAPGDITNLTKNTTYYFRLVAQNQYGSVTGNQYSFTTTVGNPAPVGSIPTTKTVSASSAGRTTAIINGNVTPNKASTKY